MHKTNSNTDLYTKNAVNPSWAIHDVRKV